MKHFFLVYNRKRIINNLLMSIVKIGNHKVVIQISDNSSDSKSTPTVVLTLETQKYLLWIARCDISLRASSLNDQQFSFR